MLSRVFQIRRSSSLPFYCDPASVFISIWIVMLASLQFQICNVCYPHLSLAILLFAGSLASFLLAYFLFRFLFYVRPASRSLPRYQIDIKRLRKFTVALGCVAVSLIAMNWISFGVPPFLSFFGIQTVNYIDYGRLRQLLFPVLMAMFLCSFLDPSIARRAAISVFSFLFLLVYLARGSILIVLFQALIIFSIRTAMSKRRIYLVAIGGLVAAALFVDIIGSNRTGSVGFFAYMQIKTEFQQWPTVYLWAISYISTPLSNLCWLVEMASFEHVTWSFAYQLLPSFWHPADPYADLIGSSYIIDGVHTYLARYYLDFSGAGVFLINFAIGAVSGFGSSANRISRNFLVWSVILSSIGFMFFWDFFAYLPTVIEIALLAVAHACFVRELPPEAATHLMAAPAPAAAG